MCGRLLIPLVVGDVEGYDVTKARWSGPLFFKRVFHDSLLLWYRRKYD